MPLFPQRVALRNEARFGGGRESETFLRWQVGEGEAAVKFDTHARENSSLLTQTGLVAQSPHHVTGEATASISYHGTLTCALPWIARYPLVLAIPS
jgi:hypothetical protein